MITYEEEWLWHLVFRWKGSVYARSLTFAGPVAIAALGLVLLNKWAADYQEEQDLARSRAGTVWNMTTSTLLFVMSLRTRQAFKRFWEATGLLHQMKGEWLDTINNCTAFSCKASKARPIEVCQFRHTIVRLMSLVHGSALEEIAGFHGRMETIDVQGLSSATLRHMKDCVETHHFNKVEVLMHVLKNVITQAHKDGILDVPPPILSRVYQTISRGYVKLLESKKITDTKFPFPLVQLLLLLMHVHLVITPLIAAMVGNSILVAPVIAFLPIFGVHAPYFISIELENPFGDEANSLPLGYFQSEMNNCLIMLLHEKTDLIPTVGKRCIMDFANLKEALTMHGECEQGIPIASSALNLFDPDFDMTAAMSTLESENSFHSRSFKLASAFAKA